MGVVGLRVEAEVVVSVSVVIEGVGSEGGGWGGGGKSSAKTRVGFGAVVSQGKIGGGRSFAGGVGGTS